MRSTLFVIPHELAGIPLFGFGWVLLAWLLFSVVFLGLLIRRQGWNKETASYVPLLVIVALIFAFFAPQLELVSPEGQRIGIPIRGFGVMMALATVAAVGLAIWRAERMGIDPDVIYSLAMWMFIPGIIGARIFYLVEYRHEFFQPTQRETLIAMLDVTKGGLVMYGSVIGGLPFGIYYLVSRKLPVLAIGDIIAPSMVVGLALGRIGCFLNGCCYGGDCEGPLGLSFPPESPPHVKHHGQGWLYGLRLAEDDRGVVIRGVDAGSAADDAGVKPSEHVATIRDVRVATLDEAIKVLTKTGPEFSLTTQDGKAYAIAAKAWPVPSFPVHPTQLYAALDAALLAAFLWFYYPFRRRDGEVFLLLLTLHPISRFLLEMIRDDEPGQFGTGLTIAQLTSLAIFVVAAVSWWLLLRQRQGTQLPHPASAVPQSATAAT